MAKSNVATLPRDVDEYGPVPEAEKIIQLAMDFQGHPIVLTSAGNLFKRVPQPQGDYLGRTVWDWQKIEGPSF